MKKIFDDFNGRSKEVERYIQVLTRLEQPEIIIMSKLTGARQKIFQEDSLKVMKATAFLLIYNLVESSIRSAFSFAYSEIGRSRVDLSKVNNRLRTIWIRQQFKQKEGTPNILSMDSVYSYTEKIVNEVIEEISINVKGEFLPISGNLDNEEILKLCIKHGVKTEVDKKARGGQYLRIVKEKRNDLSHGDSTFSDCGKDYTSTDLLRIFKESKLFLRGILKNIKKFLDKKDYIVSNPGG